MNTPTLLQFPSGDEQTLDEWKEQPTSLKEERDKFLLWEVRRNLLPGIGDMVAHEKGLNDTGKSELFRASMPNRTISLRKP